MVFACRMLCKPALQATLRVFGLCGSRVVLVWVVLWFLVTCGFWLWSAHPIVLMWFLWVGGLRVHLPRFPPADDCASTLRILRICPQVARKLPASMLMPASSLVFFEARWSCASSCSLWTAKKICPLPHFVLCSVSSPLEATFTNGENDHG